MTPAERFAAFKRRLWRTAVQQQIPPSQQPPGSADPGINRIAGTFTRFAQTQRTAFDNVTVTTTGPSGGNALESRVDRALADVLGRGVGSDSASFFDAVNARYPVGVNGQVVMTTVASGVSSFGPPTGMPLMADLNGGMATPGPLSVEQATMYRQASVISADALRVLPAIQPFVGYAEMDHVEAARDRIREGINQVLAEFVRTEEPRQGRLNAIFTSLAVDAAKLGNVAVLNIPELAIGPGAVTQIANYQLLLAYIARLAQIWQAYNAQVVPGAPLSPLAERPLSVRIARARTMLPVVSQATRNVAMSLDAIGFSDQEQGALSAEFTNLSTVPGSWLQRMTVGDYLGWSSQLVDTEGLASLTDSGEYGLLYVTREAHNLFRTLAGVLYQIRVLIPVTPNVLNSVLTHERVAWSLDDMFGQLKELADLEI